MGKILVVGSLNMDFVVNVKHMPQVGETLLADSLEFIPGGKGANQAYALGKLGADVTMLGAVGNDSYGDIQIGGLKAVGVDTTHIARIEGVNTGIALINVNQRGDNSIIVVQGANKYVSREYIDKNLKVIEESDIVIFQLEIPIDTVTYAAKKAKGLGKTVILDPAPAPDSIPEELLANVDIIKPNETELVKLTGIEEVDGCMNKAVDTIKKQGVKTVIVTLGGKGSFVSSQNNVVKHISTQDVKVIDTTAAGDSFIASMALYLSKGKDIMSAVEFANHVASISVTRKGAQSSMPSMEEVEKYISELGLGKQR
ncbi:ribokinase [Ruminiclostridium papyrosolvens]|uniref:Ribokinase n=1 Tax=Ruminiclostridium papyrosolvens C7 TaxID=1330534 RepID=U4QZX2_9FIRM|nr:ribokinase [Ruminiclostridium papyrosolvens]EPR09600.1 ribokinase [Ruminiclostridium papyrosolvens C7]